MFKFNFNVQDDEKEVNTYELDEAETKTEDLNWNSPHCHLINEDHLSSLSRYSILDTIELDDLVLHVVNLEEVKAHLSELSESKDVVEKMLAYNDLTPSIYEGGFKIWECTWDVINYIQDKKLDLREKRVLDLGCGGGIIGIYSMLKGASVTLQDYNCDVLDLFTIPNLLLNLKSFDSLNDEGGSSNNENTKNICPKFKDLISKTNFDICLLNKLFQFYYGDWNGLSELILCRQDESTLPLIKGSINGDDTHLIGDDLNDGNSATKKLKKDTENNCNLASSSTLDKESLKFDVIVTSETIYNTSNYKKLLETMALTLKECGTILVSAKVHYFGVGGSTYEFKKFVEKDCRFTIAVHPINNEGVSREILVMKFKGPGDQTT